MLQIDENDKKVFENFRIYEFLENFLELSFLALSFGVCSKKYQCSEIRFSRGIPVVLFRWFHQEEEIQANDALFTSTAEERKGARVGKFY